MQRLKELGVIIATLTLSACINIDRTRSNLIDAAKTGKHFTKAESFTVNKSLDQIVNKISKQSKKCLNKVVTYKYSGSNQVAIRRGYTFAIQRSQKDKVEFTIFLNDQPLIAANYFKLRGKISKANLYSPRNYKSLAKSVKLWTKTSYTACPVLR